jgi:hypothetical protein
MNAKRLFAIFFVLGVAASFLACGDEGPATPTPPPTTTVPPVSTPPAPPADAVVTLTGSHECLDPWCDFAAFRLTLRNTGGVGANLNYIRVENLSGRPILELGASHFINTFGNNRLEAGQTLDFVLTAQLGYVVIVNYRDDNGKTGDAKYFPR